MLPFFNGLGEIKKAVKQTVQTKQLLNHMELVARSPIIFAHMDLNFNLNPEIRSKVKVRIEGYIENGSFSPLRIDPKIDFEPYCNPQNS